MNAKILIGIDIGSNGALAANVNGAVEVWRFDKIGEDVEAALISLAARAKAEGWNMSALVEKVHATPQMGVTSAFTFGENKGRVYGALRALQIPFEEILPPAWQKPLNLPSPPPRGSTPLQKAAYKLQHKRDLYDKAKALYPKEASTKDTADALLILHFLEKGLV